MEKHELEWHSVETRACRTLAKALKVAVLFRGHGNMLMRQRTAQLMAEFGGGKRRLMWTMEFHSKYTEMCQEVF